MIESRHFINCEVHLLFEDAPSNNEAAKRRFDLSIRSGPRGLIEGSSHENAQQMGRNSRDDVQKRML
jgi:hypothetical protein